MSEPVRDTIEPADERERKMFQDFAAELTDGDNIPPQVGSRDARYYLELEKEKMQSMGITVKERLKKTEGLPRITGRVYHGNKHRGHLLFSGYERRAEYFKDGRRVWSNRERLILYQLIVNANGSPDPRETFCCPSCGGINTLQELESGCKFCGARYMMSDLYPKVTEYFWLKDLSKSPKEMGCSLLLGSFVGGIAGLALGILGASRFLQGNLESSIIMVISLGLTGAFFGPAIYLLSVFGKVLLSAFKAVPLLSRTSGDKQRIEQALRPYDPYFFYGVFESRVLSLLKIMLYSRDLSDSAVYCGNTPLPPSDVAEVRYKAAIDIQDIAVRDGYTHVTLTVFTDCVHCSGGRLSCRSDNYRMEIVRHKDAVTDQGFFIKKVECPSCGASFDATRNKRCPYCSRDYRLADHDWAVLSLRKE